MKISMLSASRASTYIQCSLKYQKTYEEGVRSEADFLDLGTIIHAVLERLYRDYAGYADIETIKDIFDDEFRNNPRLNTPEHYKQGVEMLKNFVENPVNFQYDILEVDGQPALEIEFYVDLEDNTVYVSEEAAREAVGNGRYILRGYIDKVLSTGEDSVLVMDYKTSFVMKSNYELQDDLQLDSYNYAIRQILPDLDKVEVALNYVRYGDVVRVEKTADDAEITRRYLLNLFKTIQQDTEPLAKLNQYCTYCQTKDICPEFQKLVLGEIKIDGIAIDESLEFSDVTDKKTADDLWQLRGKVAMRSKLLDRYAKLIDEKFKNYLKDTNTPSVVVGDKELFLAPNRASFYPYKATLEVLGADEIESVVSVTKGAVDKLLKNDKDKLEYLRSQAVSYQKAPSLKPRKIRK